MESRKLEHYKKKLLEKQEEISNIVSKTEQYGREADEEATQDIADKAANSYTKEFLFSQSSGDRSLLQQIQEALARLDRACYGECLNCNKEIQQKRLEAVPWARLCIECKELEEQGMLQE